MTEKRGPSAPVLFAAYAAASFVFILALNYLLPDSPAPLSVFKVKWRFFHGIAAYVTIFPALTLSAIAGTFGFGNWDNEGERRFSTDFLESMIQPLLTAIIAAVLYAALFLFVHPVARDAIADMRSQGLLFTSAAERANAAVDREDWRDASAYLGICQRVWPNSPETDRARDLLEIGLASVQAKESGQRFDGDSSNPSKIDFPGVTPRTTPTQALRLAEEAFEAQRYFDAHWLAALAERLSRSGSYEASAAARLAASAWNAIAEMQPNAAEKEAFATYKKKREGYAAVLSEDWIRAYFIYEELSRTEKNDPDVARFLKLSETGTKTVSFFSDEVGASIGAVDLNVVASLPGADSGRDILRIKRLHPFADSAYGEGLELVSFDAGGTLRYRVESPFVKAVPFRSPDSQALTALLLLALDRDDESVRWDPKWTAGSERPGPETRVILSVPYERFLLAIHARRGLDALSVPELNSGSRDLAAYGFVVERFRAEMLRRFVEPFAFLSLSVFVLAISWRSRTRRSMGAAGIPILILLPFALNLLVEAYRQLAGTSATVFATALPLGAAIGATIAFQSVLMLGALLFLAGQRS